jgi:hypothetical protein
MPARRKVTPQMKLALVDAMMRGATMGTAALEFGVSRQAIYNAMEKDPRFAEELNTARGTADDAVEAALYRNAIGGNVTAQIFWLKNRRPNEWRDAHEIDLANKDGKPLIYRAYFADGIPVSPAAVPLPAAASGGSGA